MNVREFFSEFISLFIFGGFLFLWICYLAFKEKMKDLEKRMRYLEDQCSRNSDRHLSKSTYDMEKQFFENDKKYQDLDIQKIKIFLQTKHPEFKDLP